MPAAANSQTIQDIAEHFGGTEAMLDMMEQSEMSHRWLESHEAELRAKHPDQWAAVDKDGLVATAPTRKELLENIRNKGINVKTTAISLLETEPLEMIF